MGEAKKELNSLTPDKLELEEKAFSDTRNNIISHQSVPEDGVYSPLDPLAGSITYFYKINDARVFDEHYFLLDQASARFREHIKSGNSSPKLFLQAIHALHYAMLYHDFLLNENGFKVFFKKFMCRLQPGVKSPAARKLLERNLKELKAINKLAHERLYVDLTETDRAVYIKKNGDINFAWRAFVEAFLKGRSVANILKETRDIKGLVQLRRVVLVVKNAELNMPSVFSEKSPDACIFELTEFIDKRINESLSEEERKTIKNINDGELEFEKLSVFEVKKVIDLLNRPELQDIITAHRVFDGESLESLKSKYQGKLNQAQLRAEKEEFLGLVAKNNNSQKCHEIIQAVSDTNHGGYDWIRQAGPSDLAVLSELFSLMPLSDFTFKEIFGRADKRGLANFLEKRIADPSSAQTENTDFITLFREFIDNLDGEVPEAIDLLSDPEFLKFIEAFPALSQDIKKYFVVDGYYSDMHIARQLFAKGERVSDSDVSNIKQIMKVCIRAGNMHKRGGG